MQSKTEINRRLKVLSGQMLRNNASSTEEVMVEFQELLEARTQSVVILPDPPKSLYLSNIWRRVLPMSCDISCGCAPH